jgi:hypothetical protein
MDNYPCPCCGYLIFGEPPGSYAICPICFWEDDALQLEFANTLDVGANQTTLIEAQRNYASHGACEPSFVSNVRLPTVDDRRDPEWRPIDPTREEFAEWGTPDVARPDAFDESLYYWRPSYWRRHL